MSDDPDRLHLAVMLRALDAIGGYLDGVDEDGFLASRMLVDAVAMNRMVAGEGANRLSADMKAQIPAPWVQIVGLRHRLAHEYFGLSAERLWSIASRSAPELRGQVARWLERP